MSSPQTWRRWIAPLMLTAAAVASTAQEAGRRDAKEPKPIPRQIITGWHATELPPRMTASLQVLQAANPSFTLRVFDDAQQRSYIAQHFPADVVRAYDELLPASYRSDLFRFCILSHEGGVWLDSKMGPHPNRPWDPSREGDLLEPLVQRESFIWNSEQLRHVLTGVMSARPGNRLLAAAVRAIVAHVQQRYYGQSSQDVTACALLGKLLDAATVTDDLLVEDGAFDDLQVAHEGSRAGVALQGRPLLLEYALYRADQLQANNGPHYSIAWKHRAIYRASSSAAGGSASQDTNGSSGERESAAVHNIVGASMKIDAAR